MMMLLNFGIMMRLCNVVLDINIPRSEGQMWIVVDVADGNLRTVLQ